MKFQKPLVLIISLIIMLCMVGCSASVDTANKGAMRDEYMSEEMTADGESSSNLPENRKLIQTVDMRVETEDLDSVLKQIDSRIAELKGYTESSNIQNGSAYSGSRYRSASITVRIPAKSLDSFVDKVDDISNIVSSQKSVDDVTLSYVATESRMKALQAEESRLLDLMSKANSLDDLLTVEKRLTDVRTELEEVTTALRVFDNQVDYATINLTIEEVKEFTENAENETVWKRIGSGFVKSLKNVGNFFVELFVFLIVAVPYLALFGAIALVVIFIIRFIKRKKRKALSKQDKKENP